MNRWMRHLVCSAWGLVQAAAIAQVAPPDPAALCPPCLHDQVLRGLPASVDAIVAINNAARQRSSPAGRALSEMVTSMSEWRETIGAWETLSKTLEWSPSRTFDELLGKRISLVVRGVSAPAPEWAVVTAVSDETQIRLRSRLRAAPRGAVAGLSVLSIEDGSFQLLVAPCPEAGARGERSTVVLLAPRSSEALLDELAPVLSVRQMAVPAVSERACDVVIAIRPSGSTRQSLSITATSSPDGWDATVVCDAGNVLPAGTARIEPWRDSLFRDLEPGSLLAVMSTAGLEEIPFLPDQLRSWKKWLGDLAAPESPGGRAALRTGVFVRAVGPGPARESPSARTVGLSQGIEAPAAPRGRLAVSLLSESRDSRSTLLKGDAAMARVARMIMTGESGDQCATVRFEIPSSGPRSLVVGESLPAHADIEPVLKRAFGEEPQLSWNMTDRRDGSAWWVASMAPSDAVPMREHRALTQPEAGESKRRLSIGCVRPAALERWANSIEPGLLGSTAGSRFIDSIRWDSWLRDDGRVAATINIRMMRDSAR